MAKAVHKFEKTLAKHGFVLTDILEKSFCGKSFKDLVYRNPNFKGRVVITVWPNSEVDDCTHFFIQSNGLTSPCICSSKPQLDRDLTESYLEKKWD